MLRRRATRVSTAAPSTPREPAEPYEGWVFFDARRRWLLRQIAVIAAAAGVALTIRAFGFEAYAIPSGSMLETLLIGDHLFVDKHAYGPRLPFSTLRTPAVREPERGEVVVFTVANDDGDIYPADERPDLPTVDFVKRIIGLPGDRIAYHDGRIELNGEPIAAEPNGKELRDERGRLLVAYDVELDGRRFQILDDPGREDAAVGLLTVPAGRYFVLGDNRDHSLDSRSWGTVRQVDIRGPAQRIYWSWDFNGGWLELLDPVLWWELLTERTRWERIGDAVS